MSEKESKTSVKEDKNFFIIEEVNLDENGNEESGDKNNLDDDKDSIKISIGNSREESITKTRVFDINSPSKSNISI